MEGVSDRTWPEPAAAPAALRPRMRRALILVAHDLIAVWDALTVLLTGYLCAVAYSLAFPDRPMMRVFFGDGGQLALVGALLAPFVLRGAQVGTAGGQPGTAVGIVSRLAPRVLSLLALLLATAFLTRTMDDIPRRWIIPWGLTIGVSALAGRMFLASNVRRLERAGVLRDRVAILGSGQAAAALQRHLAEVRGPALEVVGVCDAGALDQGALDHGALDEGVRAGEASRTLAALVELGKRESLDLVLVAPSLAGRRERAEDRLAGIVRELKALDVQIAFCPDMGGIELRGRSLDRLGEVPLVVLTNRAIRHWGLVLKEIEDKALGVLLLAALLPLMGLIALAVRLDSPGPVIFRQRRHGWNNGEFEVFKFRTMTWEPRGPADRLQQTRRHDARVTRVGAFLRRTSLDELPQLINVLRGEMSLVGPRPHPVVMRTEERLGHEIVAEYAHRHRVKPGITGWAQIHGCRGATDTAEQVRRRVTFDIEYVENWSVFLDLKILALTPVNLVFDSGNAF